MDSTFTQFSGVLQTGIAINLGLSAFEFVGSIFSIRLERRIEGLANCEFLLANDAIKLASFRAHLQGARTRLRQAEEALSKGSLFFIPILLLAASICAAFLIDSAWHPDAKISESVGHLCVVLSFLPGFMATAANAYLWERHSGGISDSISEMFSLIK